MHYKQELISSGSKTNITKNTFCTGWLDHCGGKPKIWQVVSKSLASEVGLLNLEFTIYCEATTIARYQPARLMCHRLMLNDIEQRFLLQGTAATLKTLRLLLPHQPHLFPPDPRIT